MAAESRVLHTEVSSPFSETKALLALVEEEVDQGNIPVVNMCADLAAKVHLTVVEEVGSLPELVIGDGELEAEDSGDSAGDHIGDDRRGGAERYRV